MWRYALIGIFRTGKFHQIGFDKSVDFPVHHTSYIRSLIVRAVVLHSAVVKDIGTDL